MSNPERYNCVIYKNNDGKAHNRYDQYNYESSPVESITWLSVITNKAALINVWHFQENFNILTIE